MYIALIALIIFVCLLLALVVLAQNPKGGGLSNQFGAGGAANLMGVKRTGDLLERLTWGFALGLMVLTLGTHMLNGTGSAGPARSINQQRALETQVPTAAPATPAPTVPGATAPAATGTATPNERAASPATQEATPQAEQPAPASTPNE